MDTLFLTKLANELGTALVNKLLLEAQVAELQKELAALNAKLDAVEKQNANNTG